MSKTQTGRLMSPSRVMETEDKYFWEALRFFGSLPQPESIPVGADIHKWFREALYDIEPLDTPFLRSKPKR